MRKGFTLVELLIVVAILAVLTTTMMVSMRGATAKAKAASIAANLDSCHTAAMLKANLKTWEKFKGDSTTDSIYYEAIGTGPDKWAVNVTFTNDSEASDIARALNGLKGYSGITAFAGDNGFDLFGATPAYAEDATTTDTTKGKLWMNLITGLVFSGSTTIGEITTSSASTEEPESTSSE